jgi:hypothetical protein
MPSHCFSNEADEKDILVPDKIGIVYHSHSEAPLPNNQSIPMKQEPKEAKPINDNSLQGDSLDYSSSDSNKSPRFSMGL